MASVAPVGGQVAREHPEDEESEELGREADVRLARVPEPQEAAAESSDGEQA